MNSVLILAISVMVIAFYSMRYSNIRDILVLGFILRFTMALAYTYILGDYDPDGYGVKAVAMMSDNIIGIIENFEFGAFTYSWFIAIIYSLVGISELMIRILNALLSTLVIVYTYKLSREFFNAEVARKGALLIAVYPILIRFSSSFASRETLLLFCMIVCVSQIVDFKRTGRIRNLINSFILSILAVSLHVSMIALWILIGFNILWWIKENKSKNYKDHIYKYVVGFILICGAIGLVMILAKLGLGGDKMYENQGGSGINKLVWLQNSSAIGRASYLKGVTSTNPIIFCMLIPVRILFFLFAPFVWMIRTLDDILGFIDATLYFLLVLNTIKAYKEFKVEIKDINNYKLIAVVTIIIITIFSLVTSNYGTALRHRSKVIPLLIILCTGKIDDLFKIKLKNRNRR